MKKISKVKRTICCLLVIVLILAGCNINSSIYDQIESKIAEDNSLASSVYDKKKAADLNSLENEGTVKEKDNLQGHLTIKTYWDEDMNVYINDFISLHPDVSIDLLHPGTSGFLSFDDYQTQTAVELMSGTSADIIDVAGLAVFKYAKSGSLCDLYSFMDSDEDFCKEDYYTNIFNGKEYEGALYSMPCGFSYDMVYVSNHLFRSSNLELPDTLDYKEMILAHKKVIESTNYSPKLMPGLNPYTFFYYEYPEYYNINTQTAAFDTPQFIEYLKFTKNSISINEENDFTRIGYDDSFLREDYLFCKFDVSGGTDLLNFLFDFKNISEPIPIVSSSGNKYFRSMREYAIASSSPNKELAWEFIKYYIGEKEIPETLDSEDAEKYYKNYNAFVPINKANFFKGFKFTYKYALQYIEKQPNIQWKNEDHDLIIENAVKQIHEWNQERDVEQAEGEIYGLLCDELNSYYYMELLSAEETADKLQNKMTIFLQE